MASSPNEDVNQPLLSELCSSCHSQQPKYKCPRCKAQTCSLDCYKQHQRRAACNGKRDPTAFVPKSQWASAAGVDHDFNFLRGLERGLDAAARDARRRGIDGAAPPKSKVAARAWHADGLLQQYLRKNRIAVQRAPLGMSRQRVNQTRATKSGKVVWTVEWIDAQGKRERQDDCLASNSIAELHHALRVQRRNAEKRRLDGERLQPVKRRKVLPGSRPPAEPLTEDPPGNIVRMDPDRRTDLLLDSTIAHERTEERPEAMKRGLDSLIKEHADELDAPFQGAHDADPTSTAPPTDETSHEEAADPPVYYYLLKPATGSAARILAPLDPKHTLTEALRDRVVQEYPTIYVLHNPPDHLPSRFLLEDDQLVVTQDAALRPTSKEVEKGAASESRTEGTLDPGAILEMLKRDVHM